MSSMKTELEKLRAEFDERKQKIANLRTALEKAQQKLATATAKRESALDVDDVTNAAQAEVDARHRIQALENAIESNHDIMTRDEYEAMVAPCTAAFNAEATPILQRTLSALDDASAAWAEYETLCRQYETGTHLNTRLNQWTVFTFREAKDGKMLSEFHEKITRLVTEYQQTGTAEPLESTEQAEADPT